MPLIYLDHNATTPVDPSVREAMLPYLGENFGNPSSLHGPGRWAKAALEDSRERIAKALSCSPREIYFTSGGTESINLAIKGVIKGMMARYLAACKGPVHVITTQVEHQAVLGSLESLEREGHVEVTRLAVDPQGEIDLDELRASIRDETALITMMFVNNEIGNIYPIAGAGKIARERKIPFHVDAVQALGKVPINLSLLPVDLMSFSAHKIYGPKGVGALYVRKGVPIHPLLQGGAQEGEKRGGTENLPGLVGFAKAVERVHEDLEKESARQKGLRDRLERDLTSHVEGVRIHGSPECRVANTSNVSFEGISSEAILVALDREGIAVSSGSACASGSLEPSHVLLAMGVSKERAKGAVRFSLGRGTNKNDIDFVLERLPAIVERLRQ